MNDHDLIESLSADLRPVSPHTSEGELAKALLAGSTVSLLALVLTLGVQPGLDMGARTAPLLMKASYTVPLLGLGFVAMRAQARPGSEGRPPLQWIAAPAGLLALIAVAQLVL